MRKIPFENRPSTHNMLLCAGVSGALAVGLSACSKSEATNPFVSAGDQAAISKAMHEVAPILMRAYDASPLPDSYSGFMLSVHQMFTNPAGAYDITIRTIENQQDKPPMDISNPNVQLTEVSIVQTDSTGRYDAEISLDEVPFSTPNGGVKLEYTVQNAADYVHHSKPVEAVDDKDLANDIALMQRMVAAAVEHRLYNG